ncbi:23S rRNA (adenine(2503)-C(2))-methyltransferase RlmN [Liberiplasma polymorphum]|uniref:23S rRNA (adenine(2503)-C(2))-methyltransferase RlmN n=1 Tax=Liberiplasma polymorphum TaxID=3374570 RepID=UPI003772FC9F
MKNIYNETLDSLKETLSRHNFKAFAARQIFEWLYKHQVTSFEEMTNISKDLRVFLHEKYQFERLFMFTRQVAKDGTKKYLFRLHDDHLIESVLMHHDYGDSLCITTQVGCNIGCSFCASGLQKRIRNLTIAEMVMQVTEVQNKEKVRISHVVIMGTGEPFDNYDNVMGFIDVINDPFGLEIGARHITVSTSGIVPKIYAFADQNKQVNLAVSLHAPNNKIRSSIMKINESYPLKELIKAVKYYLGQTNRRVTFEYILLDQINDTIEHANQLSDLLRGLNCYVNLIRYNAVEEFNFQASVEDQASKFYKQLIKRGIQATLRREMGADIDAACGQLRTNALKK